MTPTYQTHFISQRIKLSGDTSSLESEIQQVLHGVPAERIISITHTAEKGMWSVLVVLRTDPDSPTG